MRGSGTRHQVPHWIPLCIPKSSVMARPSSRCSIPSLLPHFLPPHHFLFLSRPRHVSGPHGSLGGCTGTPPPCPSPPLVLPQGGGGGCHLLIPKFLLQLTVLLWQNHHPRVLPKAFRWKVVSMCSLQQILSHPCPIFPAQNRRRHAQMGPGMAHTYVPFLDDIPRVQVPHTHSGAVSDCQPWLSQAQAQSHDGGGAHNGLRRLHATTRGVEHIKPESSAPSPQQHGRCAQPPSHFPSVSAQEVRPEGKWKVQKTVNINKTGKAWEHLPEDLRLPTPSGCSHDPARPFAHMDAPFAPDFVQVSCSRTLLGLTVLISPRTRPPHI